MRKRLITGLLAFFGVVQFSGAIAAPIMLDQEFVYVQGALEASKLSNFQGPTVDLGSGISATGTTTIDRGRGWGLALGRQWISEDEDRKQEFHRLEIELFSTSFKRQYVTFFQAMPASGDLSAEVLFLNYLKRVSERDNYRYLAGLGIGLARLSVTDGPIFSNECGCPKGGDSTGFAWQAKAVVQRPLSDSSVLNGYIFYRSLPAMSFGNSPQTQYPRFGLYGIGISIEFSL
ncbi:hypothetical protein GH816_00005 [Betaproteobacteria bacterium LSUCC0115]|nr:hypothetical protein [Burkholderiales bacterium LSUCC0115]